MVAIEFGHNWFPPTVLGDITEDEFISNMIGYYRQTKLEFKFNFIYLNMAEITGY